MKVLFVKSYPRLTSVGLLAKEFKRRGHEVHVLAPREHSDCDDMRALGMTVHVFDFASVQIKRAAHLHRSIKSLVKMIGLFKRERYDIIHLNLGSARLYGRVASLFARRSVVISTIRGFDTKYERFTNWIDDETVAVSSAVRSFVTEKAVPQEKVVTIHNGIDVGAFDHLSASGTDLHSELGLSKNIRLIGMVAFFYYLPQKGHGVLLEAARQLVARWSDVHFVFVGSNHTQVGCTQEYFRSYARSLGIEDVVHFIGERDDVPSVLKSFYAHVLPSFSEGCPMAVLEAMAAGVPNIGSRIDPIAELIDHEQNGLLFDVGNPDDLAAQIYRCLKDPGFARALGLAGRRKAERDFSAARMACAYENLFERALQ